MARVSVVTKDWPYLALSLLFVTSLHVRGATPEKTNEVIISYAAPSLTVERPERSDVLMDRFLQEATEADSIVFDRLSGPSSRLLWTRRQDNLGYDIVDRFNANGANIFTTIALDSLRTAAVEVLPLDLWA